MLWRWIEAGRHERALAQVLRETASILAGTLSLEKVLDEVLIQAGRVVKYDAAHVLLIEGETVHIVRSRGFVERGESDPAGHIAFSLHDTANLHEMYVTGRPLVISDVRSYPGWVKREHWGGWLRSYLGAPVRAKGQVIGFLNFGCAMPGAYSQSMAENLQVFANQVGLAIENARSFTAAAQRAAELEALAQLSTALRTAHRSDEMVPIILEHTIRLGKAAAGILFRVEPGTGDLVAWGWQPAGLLAEPIRHAAGTGVAGYVAATGQLHMAEDIHLDPLTHPEAGEASYIEGVHAGLSLPLRTSEGQTVGVLQLGWAERRRFPPEETHLLVVLAEMSANALDRAHAMETLEQRVAERTAELRQREAALRAANERLQEMDRLRSQFISDISHELRTPLASIKTSLYLLAGETSERTEQYLATLRRETDVLIYLIEDLLQLSRLDSGRMRPYLTRVDVGELVKGLVIDRAPLMAEHGLTLQVQVDDGLPAAWSDRNMIIQVLSNLLTNAMNYTPDGGRITVQAAVREHDGRSHVTITVADTGLGLADEDRAHLFERFYRGTAARQTGATGSGLGLSICREIMELLGGDITVESQINVGSAFTIWLPLAPSG